MLMFVAGVWMLQQASALPGLGWLVLLPVLLCPLLILQRLHRDSRLKKLGWLLFALAAGFMWAALIAHVRLADSLPSAWEGRDIELVGVVASLPQTHDRGQRFTFEVERVLTPGAVVPQHISLTQYQTGYSAFADKTDSGTALTRPVLFHAGERWQITVRLKRPHGNFNPHGFDLEAWLLERDIRATGYVRDNASSQRLRIFVAKPRYAIEALRESIRARMVTVLVKQEYAGVLQALAIGDEGAIQQDHWKTLLSTGTNHLMSISGLHITMLAGLAFGLVSHLWRRSAWLTLRLPARKAGTAAGLLAALLYALIAGFAVPTQRTLYMLMVFALALWLGRNIAVSRVLIYALGLVVVLDPWAVLAPGFWLSFGAVGVIAYAVAANMRRPHWLQTALTTQWAVTLGLLPLLLVLFQQFSLVSPLANALAIPIVSFVVVPLTLLGALLPLQWPLALAHGVLSGLMHCLQWLAELPMSIWQQAVPPMWTLLVALLGVVWLLLPRGFPMRWLGLVGLLPMFLLQPPRPEPGAMQVTVLDVGQGLAVVIKTAGHALLYDAGPRYSEHSDSGLRIVLPYLRAAGISRLDGMVVSHDDDDHSGGMRSILAQIPVTWVTSSLPQSASGLAAVRHVPCQAGQSWQWDGVQFEMMSPNLASYAHKSVKDNNRSCVLRVTSRFGKLLLPGDIERAAEDGLLEAMTEQLSADVLLVPHHGSKTSSSKAFVAAVNPHVAIFTVGYRNRFGHPKQEILQRYEEAGSRIYRSDRDGAILLDFSQNSTAGIAVTNWRLQAQRYWHDRGNPLPALAETTAAR